MLSAFVTALIIGSLMVVPLGWRVWQDRRVERALTVRASVHAAVVRALGGESLVAVNVEAPVLWRPGRVVLTAPADWGFLLEPAWAAVVRRVPAGYELVVKPVIPDADLVTPELALRRAA